MPDKAAFLVVALDEWQVALPLGAVERVVRAVEVTPLPGAPAAVSGLISVAGQPLPVVPVRARFGLAMRPVAPGDHFVVARSTRRSLVLWVDRAIGVVEPTLDAVVPGAGLLPRGERLAGTVRLPDGLLVIEDLEALLSPEDEAALRAALRRQEPAAAAAAETGDA